MDILFWVYIYNYMSETKINLPVKYGFVGEHADQYVHLFKNFLPLKLHAGHTYTYAFYTNAGTHTNT